MGSSGDPPKPTDPNQVIQQQTSANQNAGTSSQAGSMVNQNNTFGNLTYRQTGIGPNGVPTYTADTTLSPTEQALYNKYVASRGIAGGQASDLLTGANYGARQPGDVIGDATTGNTNALMQKYSTYYQPLQQTAKTQLDTQLKSQGLSPGTPAYDNAMRSLDENQNMSNSLAAANFEKDAYSQAANNYTLPAQMALQLAAFGAPQTPNSSFVNAPGLNIQPANVTGAYANYDQNNLDAWKAQTAQNSAMWTGLMGLPTSLVGGWAKGGFTNPFSGGGSGSYNGGYSLGDVHAE